jgi:hypothetical protein|tara:strand:- start:550 stop:744 length:195 start_codon:yes stop_codon:yes gene_type:complete
MIDVFTRVMKEKIREDINHYADAVTSGSCKSFDEYQKLCGLIQGLRTAEDHLISLAKQVEESDD